MLMLASVLSRVRRQLRRQKSRHQLQPPDLRRWSDFMNPFPHVSPGGYRLYYETHGMPQPKQLQLPPAQQQHNPGPGPVVITVSAPRRPMPRRQPNAPPGHSPVSLSSPAPVSPKPTPTSSSSSSPPPIPPRSRLRDAQKSSRALSTIPEAASRQSMRTLSSSLRRRRRQLLLRTPSVERDFPSSASTIALSGCAADLDGDGDDSSGSSLRHPYMMDTPPTTVEGLEEEEWCDEDGDKDPYERPDSRASYCTARSEFSDD